MDLSSFGLEDLLLAALKSEAESKDVYATLADRVKNAILKRRLQFLADEEEKHREFVQAVYKKNFPQKKVKLPKETPVPLPTLKIPDESVPLSTVFDTAMEAELASRDFYKGLVNHFEDASIQQTLQYFSAMEMTHYTILKAEQETIKRFEQFDEEWPMMNVGP
ncbi:MAG: ferritin family protein [Candidatus Methanofastidiosia archaeon]|jgi:rubrerythrin